MGCLPRKYRCTSYRFPANRLADEKMPLEIGVMFHWRSLNDRSAIAVADMAKTLMLGE